MKFMRKAKGHFVTLIEIGMHLIMYISVLFEVFNCFNINAVSRKTKRSAFYGRGIFMLIL